MFSSKSNKDDQFALRFSDADEEAQRYVAGSQFFNYETFGAIREGGPIKLISRQFVGLVISGIFSEVVYFIMSSCVSPTLSNVLKFSPTQASAAQHLIEDLPATLSFFAGFISDCLPIGGFHRKPYMLIGWVWAAIMLSLITAMMWMCTTSIPSNVYILLAMGCSFGTLLPYVQGEILIVELSQRESLQERGSLIARYQYWRILGSTIGRIVTIVIIKVPTLVQMQYLLTLLAFIALIPPLALMFFLEEHRMSRSLTWKQAAQTFYKTSQQKVVWNISVFVMIFTFCLSFGFPSDAGAIMVWAKATETNHKVIAALVQNACTAFIIFVWQKMGLNLGWPAVFLWCTLFQFVPGLLLALLTCANIVRSPTLVYIASGIQGFSNGLNRINLPIILTEIVELGSEGSTVGLVLSFAKNLTMFAGTMAPKLGRAAGWDVTPVMIQQDTLQIRHTVMTASSVAYIVNLLSVLGLFFMPTQKLDAQQRRTYGGFSKQAAHALFVSYMCFFIYSLVQNISSTL